MRSWLLFLFIIPCLRLAAQTDSAVRPAPVVESAPVKERSTSSDTVVNKPVRKQAPAAIAPAVKKDSSLSGHTAPAKVLTPPPPLSRSVAPAASPASAAPITAPVITPATAVTDSVPQSQTVPLQQETDYDLYLKKLSAENVFLQRNKPSRVDVNKLRAYEDLDWLVYMVAGVVLLLGVIRLSYHKYFTDLFKAFLNPTLSQRQLKEQLSQSSFPNFLLNSFFVISMALYLYLLMYRQQYILDNTAWMVIPGLVVLVTVVYGVKYVMLRFCGWLFGGAELADAYIFVLYLINKVLGILLVPFLVILAFGRPELVKAFMYISVFFIVLLVAYRYIRSYSVVKQYLSFSRLHFFLYLCAFEVAPVLIITKVLLVALTGGH